MAYSEVGRGVSIGWTDERLDKRTRQIEVSTGYSFTDTAAGYFDAVSKCGVRTFVVGHKWFDSSVTGAADSEVSDTTRLYFRLPADDTGHFDLVDVDDSCFLAETGQGANIVVDYADMAGGSAAAIAMKAIIDLVVAGSILISDGETASAYLYGERLT